MCVWFWDYPSIMFLPTFSTFSANYFPGPISIRIDTLWSQHLLEFSTGILKLCIILHSLKMCVRFEWEGGGGLSSYLSTFVHLFDLDFFFQVPLVYLVSASPPRFFHLKLKTMHTCFTWSEDVYVFFFVFFFFFLFFFFFFVYFFSTLFTFPGPFSIRIFVGATPLRVFYRLLTHLSHSDKLSFCDHILSVVRRASVRASVNNFFKRHILLNHCLHFDQTSQESYLVGPLSKLFKWFRFIAHLGHRS